MQRHQRIAILVLVLALGVTSGLVWLGPRATPDPNASEPRRPDQPDLAHELFISERVTAGRKVDFLERYTEAREHMKSMPVYDSSRGELVALRAGAAAGPETRGSWRPLGPGNIGGRTRAIVIHPGNPDVMYAAGVSGGIWRTFDGGGHWRPLADLLPVIQVSVLVMSPDDPQVLYAGTGEGVFVDQSAAGIGIFKSTDSGRTWTHLAKTAGQAFRFVNDLIVSPRDPRRLYAATNTGVLRSSNGGQTWTRSLNASSQSDVGCLELALRTDLDHEMLFASCGSFDQATVYRNTVAETGNEWEAVLTETDMSRTTLAIAPTDPNVIYALAASRGRLDPTTTFGLLAVFRSDQGGEAGTWTAVTRSEEGEDKLDRTLLGWARNAFQEECFGDTDSEPLFVGQGFYDNVIAVDPTDADVVFVGGVNLYRSDDGGANWGQISYWFESPPSAHADHHAIVFHPGYDGDSNQTMIVGNDGGLWRTRNARAAAATGPTAPCSSANTEVRWESLNSGYAVTQFYHGLPFPDGRSYFGGTQDNGTVFGDDAGGLDEWIEILGGDGGYVAVDPADPRVFYAETQFLGLVRFDPRTGPQPAIRGITEPRHNFLFITPFTMDPNDSRRLWTGGQRLWTTRNGARNWVAASGRLRGTVTALAVAPGRSNRVLVGLNDGMIARNDRALSARPDTQWPQVRLQRFAYVSWLAFDPHDDDVVYATSTSFDSDHVFKSVDGGLTWTPIDGGGPGGLPRIPADTIVVDPDDSRRLFVGTDLGVFVSTTGGREWAIEDTGFAHTFVEALSVLRLDDGQNYLYAFTHGRGAWRVALR